MVMLHIEIVSVDNALHKGKYQSNPLPGPVSNKHEVSENYFHQTYFTCTVLFS